MFHSASCCQVLLSVCDCYLEHGVGEEGLQHAALASSVGLVLFEQLVEVPVLFAVGQNLQTVLVVPYELLVNVQHGQQDIEQVG